MEEYKIYYFGKLKINRNNSVEQIPWSLEEFEKCMVNLDSNIPTLIYLEDLDELNCARIARLFLRLKAEGKIYTNVTIYNKTTNAHKTIFQLPIFKKVLNIFPFDKMITICDNSIDQALRYINKSISVIFDPSKPPDKCFSFVQTKPQKGGTSEKKSDFEQIFIFRIMETNDATDLEQTWWYKYYFSIPPCAYGRLSQSSETCWLNTVLNIIFLTEPIREMLISKYKTLDKELIEQVEQISEFSHIAAKDFPLKVILWSIVRLLLVQKKKALTLDGNFILIVAAKVKSLHLHGNENYWLENNFGADFGNEYNDRNAISIVLSQLLEKMEDYFILFNSSTLDYNVLKQFDQLIDKYETLKNTFDETSKEYFIELENKRDDLFNLRENTYSIIRKIIDSDKLITLKWSDLRLKFDYLNLFKNLNPSNPPKILIVPTFDVLIKNIPEIIYIEDTEYKLNAMSIRFYSDETQFFHLVSGLVCGSKYYIYDSNNILTYDSWNKNVYNNYIDALNDFYNVNGFAYEYRQSFLLYIRT
jgi:hypothetical protein